MNNDTLNFKLLKACASGTLEEVQTFLDTGADVHWQIPYSDTDSFWNDIPGASAAHYAAENPDIRIIKLLQTYGADVDCRDIYDNSPLYYAVRGNHLEMVDYLIEQGNDPLLENCDGVNLLGAAACNPHKNVLERLLQAGVDVNGVSDIIPFAQAIRYGTNNDIDFFILHNADLERALEACSELAPSENIRYASEHR